MTLHAVGSTAWVREQQWSEEVEAARSALGSQADALHRMARRLGAEFGHALKLVLACQGRIVVCGMGKSGLIGRKVAATLASTGSPACFLHPGDAMHGDLGTVTSKDMLLLLSNSGQTDELVWLLPHFRGLKVPMVAMVGHVDSAVGRAADVVLDTSVEREACPHNLAPTTSALTTLAMGDALAVAAMRARNFSPKDFAAVHPGGILGQRLRRRVCDVMKYLDLPLADEQMPVEEALPLMSGGRCGLVIITDGQRRPLGIVTDGDLRRALHRPQGLKDTKLSEIMTRQPVTIPESAPYVEAQERMIRLRLKALIAVDGESRVTGVVEIFDDD